MKSKSENSVFQELLRVANTLAINYTHVCFAHRARLCYVYIALTSDCAQCNERCQSMSLSLGTGGSPSTGVPNPWAADQYRSRACQEPGRLAGGERRASEPSCTCFCSRSQHRPHPSAPPRTVRR